MTPDTNTDPNPAEALAAIEASRRTVHDRIATKGWRYDLTYAALAAVMVGAQVLDNPFNILGITLGVLGLAVLFQSETKRTGLLITGVTPRAARWVAIAMGLLMGAIMLGLVALRFRTDLPVTGIGAGATGVAFVIALIGSRVWRRVYRAEMRGAA